MEKGQEYYKLACLLDWDLTQIEKICHDKHINLNLFKLAILDYIDKVLKKQIYELSTIQMNCLFNEEKRKDLEIYKKVIIEIIAKYPKLNRYFLESEDIKEILGNYFLYFLIQSDFNRQRISSKCFNWGLSCEKVIMDAANFALTKLNYSQEEFEESFRKLLVKTAETSFEILKHILQMPNKETVFSFFNKTQYDISYLKKKIPEFLILYIPPAEKEQTEKILLERIEYYESKSLKLTKKKEKKQTRLEVERELAINLIKEFISLENISKEEFISLKGITEEKFEKALEYVKEFDKDLYDIYCKKVNTIFKLRYSYYIQVAKYVINCLTCGIEENGYVRKFTILDYYLYTSANLETVLAMANKSPLRNKTGKLANFVKRYKKLTPITPQFIRQIMKDKIVVGLEFNSQGEVIENSGYEVLDSDKELIFNFLNQQDWYYEEFFTPAMTLYKKGLLNLETDMDITR